MDNSRCSQLCATLCPHRRGLKLWSEIEIPIVIDDNGTEWTPIEIDDTYWLNEVIWDGHQFLSVGNGIIVTSPDGYFWNVQQHSEASLKGIAWNGSLYIAVGFGGAIHTSINGSNWTIRSSGFDAQFLAVASSNEMHVAVGYKYETQQLIIYNSTNGFEWTKNDYTLDIPYRLTGVVWANNVFVAVGTSTANKTLILTSPNGLDWTDRGFEGYFNLHDIFWTGTRFYAVGNNLNNKSIITSSADGITWDNSIIDGKTFYGLVYSGSTFVAVGERKPLEGIGGIFTSKDGVSWQERASNNFYTLRSIVWSGDRYVTTGNPFLIYVSDY